MDRRCKVSLKKQPLSRYDEAVVCFPKQAIFKLIPKDEVARLPDDENTAEKRADKLWNFFDKGENGEIPLKSRQICALKTQVSTNTQADCLCAHSRVTSNNPSMSFALSPPERVAEGEFIQGVLDNDEALRLIQYQPSK